MSSPQRPSFKPAVGLTPAGAAAHSRDIQTKSLGYRKDQASALVDAAKADYDFLIDSHRIGREIRTDAEKAQTRVRVDEVRTKYGLPTTGDPDKDAEVTTTFVKGLIDTNQAEADMEKDRAAIEARVARERAPKDIDEATALRLQPGPDAAYGPAEQARMQAAERDNRLRQAQFKYEEDLAETARMTLPEATKYLDAKYKEERGRRLASRLQERYGLPLGEDLETTMGLLNERRRDETAARAAEATKQSKANFERLNRAMEVAADRHDETAFRSTLSALREERDRLRRMEADAEPDQRGPGTPLGKLVEDAESEYNGAVKAYRTEFPDSPLGAILSGGGSLDDLIRADLEASRPGPATDDR